MKPVAAKTGESSITLNRYFQDKKEINTAGLNGLKQLPLCMEDIIPAVMTVRKNINHAHAGIKNRGKITDSEIQCRQPLEIALQQVPAQDSMTSEQIKLFAASDCRRLMQRLMYISRSGLTENRKKEVSAVINGCLEMTGIFLPPP